MRSPRLQSSDREKEDARKRTGDFEPRLEWSELELGMVLSSFNYGQVHKDRGKYDRSIHYFVLLGRSAP